MNNNDINQRIEFRFLIFASTIAILIFPNFVDIFVLPKFIVLHLGLLYFLLYIAIMGLQQHSKLLFYGILTYLFFISISIFQYLRLNTTIDKLVLGEWARNLSIFAYFNFVLLSYLFSMVVAKDSARRYLTSLVFLGNFFGLFGLLQISGLDPLENFFGLSNESNFLLLTLGNSNYSSSFLGFIFSASYGILLSVKSSRLIQILATFNCLSLGYLIFSIPDLQGKVLTIFSICVITILKLGTLDQKLRKRLIRLWTSLLFTSSMFFVFAFFGRGPFALLISENSFSLKDRFYFWQSSLNMLKNNILFGVGSDSFGENYRIYRTLEGVQFRKDSFGGTNNAHGVFLQIGSTLGLLFLCFFIGSIVVLTLMLFRLKSTFEDSVIWGALVSCWIIFWAQVSISPENLTSNSWAALLAGIILGVHSKFEINKNSSSELKVVKFAKPIRELKNLNKIFVLMLIITFISLTPKIVEVGVNELKVKSQINSFRNSNSYESLGTNTVNLVRELKFSHQPGVICKVLGDLILSSNAIGGSKDIVDQVLDLSIWMTSEFPSEICGWDTAASILESRNLLQQAFPFRQASIALDPNNPEMESKLQLYDK